MVAANQVFLVQYQEIENVGGQKSVSSEIRQAAVVAQDGQAAAAAVAEQQPSWSVLGFTSLAEFEDAVVKLRAAVEGSKTDWPLVVAPGMGA